MIFDYWIQLVLSLSLVSAAFSTDNIQEESKIEDEEESHIRKYFERAELFENVAGYKLPLNLEDNQSFHAATSEQIETLKNIRETAFDDSTLISPIIRYERPGYLILPDELHNACAVFRAKKGSIDPAAYSVQEKKDFVNLISELNVFKENIEGVDVCDKMILSRTLVATHFCRDALRIVANVLNTSQMTWLLKYSPSVVLCSSEFMDQLENFSMFSGDNVLDGSLSGHYDWFKNEKALRSLPASALLALFHNLRYDLSLKQLEALNAARPIHKLFKEPEFVGDAFVWQISAGTEYFRDEHFNINNLIQAINEGSPNSLDDIKQGLLAVYVFSEHAIVNHVNSLRDLPQAKSAELNLSVELISEVVENHVAHLNNSFSHRQAVLEALKDLTSIDTSIPYLIELFAKPSTFCFRKALKILEQVKQEEFTRNEDLKVEDLIVALRRCANGKLEYFRSTAIIFAYLELTQKPSKLPYRDIPNSSTMSTSKFVELLPSSLPKQKFLFPLMFLIGQAEDFVASRQFQNEDRSENVEGTLQYIFDLLGTCNMGNIEEPLIESIKKDFPVDSKKFMGEYNDFVSVDASFDDFRQELMEIYAKISSDESCDTLDRIAQVAKLENELMAVVQNLFKIEMAQLSLGDSGLLKVFSEYAHLLKRSQVAELFNSETGIRLLSSNRILLYNLPTYEDITAAHLELLKFQAQYANMLRTVPITVCLISFMNDKYIFNDPLGVSWRLFSCADRIKDKYLLMNAWRIAPAQFFAESWTPESITLEMKTLYIKASLISNYLTNSREFKGKKLERIRSILHWTIVQELKFLEAFTLTSSKCEFSFDVESKKQFALNLSFFGNQLESKERHDLVQCWDENIQKVMSSIISEKLLTDFMEILKGPLSQIRAGALLAGADVMDKNIRLYKFNKYFGGFTEWIDRMKKEYSSAGIAKYKKAKSTIPKFRDIIDNDMKARHALLSKLLDKIDKALNVKDPIWQDRLRLLGMISADGFTISKFFKTKKFNLPIHETVIHRKWQELAGLIGGRDSFPEEFLPEKLAVEIFVENSVSNAKDSVDSTTTSVAVDIEVDAKKTESDSKTDNLNVETKSVTKETESDTKETESDSKGVDAITKENLAIKNKKKHNKKKKTAFTTAQNETSRDNKDTTDMSNNESNAIVVSVTVTANHVVTDTANTNDTLTEISVAVVDNLDSETETMDGKETHIDASAGDSVIAVDTYYTNASIVDIEVDPKVNLIESMNSKVDNEDTKTDYEEVNANIKEDTKVVDSIDTTAETTVTVNTKRKRTKKNKKAAFTYETTDTVINDIATTDTSNIVADTPNAYEAVVDTFYDTSDVVENNSIENSVWRGFFDPSSNALERAFSNFISNNHPDFKPADVPHFLIDNPFSFFVANKDLLDLELLDLSLSINSNWFSGAMNGEEIKPLLVSFWEKVKVFHYVQFDASIGEWAEVERNTWQFQMNIYYELNNYVGSPLIQSALMHPNMKKMRLTLQSPICQRAISVAVSVLTSVQCAYLFRNAPIEVLDDPEILKYLPDYSQFMDNKSIEVLVKIFGNKWQMITKGIARTLPIYALHRVIEARNFDISAEERSILLFNRPEFHLQEPFASDYRIFRILNAENSTLFLPNVDLFMNRILNPALIESILAYYVLNEHFVYSTLSSIVDIWADSRAAGTTDNFMQRAAGFITKFNCNFSERRRLIAGFKQQHLGNVSEKLVQLLETPLIGSIRDALLFTENNNADTDLWQGALSELFSYNYIKESIPYNHACVDEEIFKLWNEIIFEGDVGDQFKEGKWTMNFIQIQQINIAMPSEYEPSEKYKIYTFDILRRHPGAVDAGQTGEFDWFLLPIEQVFIREAGRNDDAEKKFRITRELKKILKNVLFDYRVIEAIWADKNAMRAILDYPDCLDQDHVNALVRTDIGNELLRGNPGLINNLPTYSNFSLDDINSLDLRLDSGALAIGTLGVETAKAWLKQEEYLVNSGNKTLLSTSAAVHGPESWPLVNFECKNLDIFKLLEVSNLIRGSIDSATVLSLVARWLVHIEIQFSWFWIFSRFSSLGNVESERQAFTNLYSTESENIILQLLQLESNAEITELICILKERSISTVKTRNIIKMKKINNGTMKKAVRNQMILDNDFIVKLIENGPESERHKQVWINRAKLIILHDLDSESQNTRLDLDEKGLFPLDDALLKWFLDNRMQMENCKSNPQEVESVYADWYNKVIHINPNA